MKNSDLYIYKESKLIVADFELDIKGSISNFNSIVTVLKEELSSNALGDWDKPKVRREHLEKFRYKLESFNRCNSLRSKEDIRLWLKSKRG